MNCCLQCATAEPDGRKRALVIGGGIANFTDVAATFSGIIRALREKVRCKTSHRLIYIYNFLIKSSTPYVVVSYQEAKLKAARMSLYVRRGGPNYQKGLEKMRILAEEIGLPIEVYIYIYTPCLYSVVETCKQTRQKLLLFDLFGM